MSDKNVRCCTDCPGHRRHDDGSGAIRFSYCGLVDRSKNGIIDEPREAPPNWCPLRLGPITIKLVV